VEPAGTDVVILVVDEADTVAETPLIVTVLSPGVVLNPVPVIVTKAPIAPLVGEKEVIVVGIKVNPAVEPVFPLAAASAATLASTLTVTSPAAAGVMVAE
jgi:hypothetical protein